jgi:hypothetical protein
MFYGAQEIKKEPDNLNFRNTYERIICPIGGNRRIKRRAASTGEVASNFKQSPQVTRNCNVSNL